MRQPLACLGQGKRDPAHVVPAGHASNLLGFCDARAVTRVPAAPSLRGVNDGAVREANGFEGPRSRVAALASQERGQVLVLLVAALLALALGVGALGALGRALLGKGRMQRAADLAAVSAARSMRDDFPRLFEPALDRAGRPNPLHLEKPLYLQRARRAAVEVASLNGANLSRTDVEFPDRTASRRSASASACGACWRPEAHAEPATGSRRARARKRGSVRRQSPVVTSQRRRIRRPVGLPAGQAHGVIVLARSPRWRSPPGSPRRPGRCPGTLSQRWERGSSRKGPAGAGMRWATTGRSH